MSFFIFVYPAVNFDDAVAFSDRVNIINIQSSTTGFHVKQIKNPVYLSGILIFSFFKHFFKLFNSLFKTLANFIGPIFITRLPNFMEVESHRKKLDC